MTPFEALLPRIASLLHFSTDKGEWSARALSCNQWAYGQTAEQAVRAAIALVDNDW